MAAIEAVVLAGTAGFAVIIVATMLVILERTRRSDDAIDILQPPAHNSSPAGPPHPGL